MGTRDFDSDDVIAGRLVLGASSPAAPLHVKAPANTEAVKLEGTNGYNLIRFKDLNGNHEAYVGLGSTGTTSPLIVANLAADGFIVMTNATERLHIDSQGNVGIGTTSPGAPLHVKAPANTEAVKLQGTNGYNLIRFNDLSDQPKAYIGLGSTGTTSPLIVANLAADGFVVMTNATERLRIDSQGNVGIGAQPTGEKLEVNGNIKVSGTGTFGGATTQGLTIGNGRIYAFADQNDAGRLDLVNGVVEIFGNRTLDPAGGVYVRIASAGAENGQGAFRVRNLGNTSDMLRVTAAGEVYVNEVKAVRSDGIANKAYYA